MSLLDDPVQFSKIFHHFRSGSIFRNVSRHDFARLLSAATVKEVTPGEQVCVADVAPGAPPSSSFYILLSGDFNLNGSTIPGGIQNGIVGVEDVVNQAPRSVTLNALSKGIVAEIPATSFRTLLGSSTPFRQSLNPLGPIAAAGPDCIAPCELASRGNVVQFISDIPDMPLSLLIELLSREIATSFADSVLVLRACAPGQAPSVAPILLPNAGLGALSYMLVDANVIADVATHVPHYDYVMLDGVTSPAVDVVVKLFFGYPQEFANAPVGMPRIFQTCVVGQPPLPCSEDLQYINANMVQTKHRGDCRIRLDLVQLRALAQVWNPYLPLVSLDETLTREMGVWARALTCRRTGVVLAGGGVWSMQSVYLLRELYARGVPVDVITGASAGAMVGGFYSVLGLAGLDRIVECGDSGILDLLITAWMVCPAVAQNFLEREFGKYTCLDHLWVDFRPNATNLTSGLGVAFTEGPVALAVRAAASAPPLFAPTFSGSQRFVDGAFSNNVAAQVLPYFGANLTFAANTYPPSYRPNVPWVPGFVTRTLSLGPLNRLFDFTVALNLLANITGAVEGGYADIAYDASATIPFPFLLTSDFRKSSQIVNEASQNPVLNGAIDAYVARWEHLRLRGQRTWDTLPP